MMFSKKAKCQGCSALLSGLDADKKSTFTCKLGYQITFRRVSGVAMQPQPMEKCYKPITSEEYEKAEKLTDRRDERPLTTH